MFDLGFSHAMNEEGKGVAISTKADLEIQSLFGIVVVAHPGGCNWKKLFIFPYYICLFFCLIWGSDVSHAHMKPLTQKPSNYCCNCVCSCSLRCTLDLLLLTSRSESDCFQTNLDFNPDLVYAAILKLSDQYTVDVYRYKTIESI